MKKEQLEIKKKELISKIEDLLTEEYQNALKYKSFNISPDKIIILQEIRLRLKDNDPNLESLIEAFDKNPKIIEDLSYEQLYDTIWEDIVNWINDMLEWHLN